MSTMRMLLSVTGCASHAVSTRSSGRPFNSAGGTCVPPASLRTRPANNTRRITIRPILLLYLFLQIGLLGKEFRAFGVPGLLLEIPIGAIRLVAVVIGVVPHLA